MSTVLRNEHLRETGDIHFGRKRQQPRSIEIREYFENTSALLAHERREFTCMQLECIARAFAKVVGERSYTVYACAVMPDHIHILIRKHRDTAEEMIAHLQRESHLLLCGEEYFDLEHPIWGGHGWIVFIDSPNRVRSTIRYVRTIR